MRSSPPLVPPTKSRRATFSLSHTRAFVDQIFGPSLHALRVLSLANGVQGVLDASVLSIHAIGQAYAAAALITAKSGVKQLDRLLSNSNLRLESLLERWVRHVVGDTQKLLVALDWTDFEKDDHTTLCAYLVTTHGRAMPLAWKTVAKSSLKGTRTRHEVSMVENLHAWLPESTEVTLLADRAFGSQDFYRVLELYGWDYVIRFRECIVVESDNGESRAAADWVPTNGRARKLVGARVTEERTEVGAVVCIKAKGMKDAWCLATSLSGLTPSEIVKLYGRRFTIEETFRDTKDLHFGMGLSATHIGDAQRRDRLLLLIAMGQSLLTLLGAASEASGLDRYLKVNTVKKRTHSLLRQGLYWYGCLPTMREEWLRRLMTAYETIIRENSFFGSFFAAEMPAISSMN